MNQPHRRLVIRNAGFLYLLQFSNYILPLVALPILIRRVGPETYGVVALGFSLLLLGWLLSDLGFEYSATYAVSKAEGHRAVTDIMGSVFATKLTVAVGTCAGILAFVGASDQYSRHFTFFLYICGSVLAGVFQPVWLFQGLQRMGFVTASLLASRASYVVLVVALVHDPSDLSRIGLIHAVTTGLGSFIGLAAARKVGYWPTWPGFGRTLTVARASVPFLWTRVATVWASAGTVALIALVGSSRETALFSVCEQIYRALGQLAMPIVVAMLPHMAVHRDFSMLRKTIWVAAVASVAGVALTVGVGRPVLSILFGPAFEAAHSVLIALVAAFGLQWLSLLVGLAGYGALGRVELSNRFFAIGGLLHLGVAVTLAVSTALTPLNAALSLLGAQVMVLALHVVRIRSLRAALGSTSHDARIG